MFLHLSVILFTGGGVHPPLGRHPQAVTPPPGQTPSPRHTPPWVDTPRQPPPPRRPLQRTVRILLECILVTFSFQKFISCLHRPFSVSIVTLHRLRVASKYSIRPSSLAMVLRWKNRKLRNSLGQSNSCVASGVQDGQIGDWFPNQCEYNV